MIKKLLEYLSPGLVQSYRDEGRRDAIEAIFLARDKTYLEPVVINTEGEELRVENCAFFSRDYTPALTIKTPKPDEQPLVDG